MQQKFLIFLYFYFHILKLMKGDIKPLGYLDNNVDIRMNKIC